MLWNYLRKKVSTAILAGVQDAIETLEANATIPEPLSLPEPLRLRLEGGEEETESVAGKVKRAR